MRGDGGDGGDDLDLAAAPSAVDDAALDVPNCPSCLHRMEPEESARTGEVYWRCLHCGQVRLA